MASTKTMKALAMGVVAASAVADQEKVEEYWGADALTDKKLKAFSHKKQRYQQV